MAYSKCLDCKKNDKKSCKKCPIYKAMERFLREFENSNKEEFEAFCKAYLEKDFLVLKKKSVEREL